MIKLAFGSALPPASVWGLPCMQVELLNRRRYRSEATSSAAEE